MGDQFTNPLDNHPKYERIKHLGTGEEVAVKLIGLGEKFYQKYVDREILNHRLLVHPHIVSFKEVFLTEQHLGIVMEYVGGGNLQEWVQRHGCLPEWQARCFFQQITLALHYIHKQLGIAHRDIKLGNILLNDRFSVPILKLCDFGYSKSMLVSSVPKTRVGTAAYISPEVARTSGQAAYDTEKADVWSSAVTLFCMMAARYPFADEMHVVHLKRIKELTPGDVEASLGHHIPGASPGCVSLLRRMLAVDPLQRMSLDDIMVDPWFRQYLPDLSKMTVAQPRELQSETEVLALLAAAERMSLQRRQMAASDEFGDEAMDGMLDEVETEEDEFV